MEKIERNSEVDCAICLFSADDFGREKSFMEEVPRARQNVIFETGFFIGKLGRNHIIILSDKRVELPSDLNGVVYTDTRDWKADVLKELRSIGYNIDFNLLYD